MIDPDLQFLLDSPDWQGDTGDPLYLRLAAALRARLADSGRDGTPLRRDSALPAEREIAAALGVSRVTVRKAIEVLTGEGLLIRRRGAGTFIANRMKQELGHLTSFSDDMAQRGRVTGVMWLERALREANEDERQALELAPGERVAHLYRLRTADEQPLALELAALPERLVPDPAAVSGSLYAYLNRERQRPVKARQRLRAVPCAPDQAPLLRVPTGSPILYIERRSWLGDGSPVEFTRSHYRGDSYDFVADMRT